MPKARSTNSYFAADVVGDIEDGRLTLAKGAHHLKSHDGCVGCLQRLEAPHGAD